MDDICHFLLIFPLGFRRSYSRHIIIFFSFFPQGFGGEYFKDDQSQGQARIRGVLGFKLILLLGIILPCVNGRHLPQAPVRHSHNPHDRTHPFMATVPYVYNPHGSSMKLRVRSICSFTDSTNSSMFPFLQR